MSSGRAGGGRLQRLVRTLALDTWPETAKSHSAVQRIEARHTAANGSRSPTSGNATFSVQGTASIEREMVVDSMFIAAPSKIIHSVKNTMLLMSVAEPEQKKGAAMCVVSGGLV